MESQVGLALASHFLGDIPIDAISAAECGPMVGTDVESLRGIVAAEPSTITDDDYKAVHAASTEEERRIAMDQMIAKRDARIQAANKSQPLQKRFAAKLPKAKRAKVTEKTEGEETDISDA